MILLLMEKVLQKGVYQRHSFLLAIIIIINIFCHGITQEMLYTYPNNRFIGFERKLQASYSVS